MDDGIESAASAARQVCSCCDYHYPGNPQGCQQGRACPERHQREAAPDLQEVAYCVLCVAAIFITLAIAAGVIF